MDELDITENSKQKLGKKSKKDKRKKKNDEDDDEEVNAMLADLALEMEGKKPLNVNEPLKTTATKNISNNHIDEDGTDEDIDLQKQTKKNNKKKKNKKPSNNQSDEVVKESAPKPVLKKNDSSELNSAGISNQKAHKDSVDGDIPSDSNENENVADRKDKKKKKDKDKKEAAKVKGPSKKQIALMQEILKKQKEEEEKAEREEEERIKREEEAERLREEKLRLEKERKDRKKQKEKERKERLKKEGKLLTAKQKEQRNRALESLQIAQQTGQIIIGKAKTDADKKNQRKDQRKKHIVSQESEESKSEEIVSKEEVSEDQKDQESTEEEVLEDWEEMAVNTSSKQKKVLAETNSKIANDNKFSDVSTNNSKPNTPTTTIPSSIYSSSTNVASRPPGKYRSPIICVLGHVDTGKTKLLDYIRKTHVQDNEAGGITQQIGATFVPPTAIAEQCKNVKSKIELQLPGLLIIDTPGHESFTNLRSRGSSLCDIAILVIDIMHGLENQTIESLNLLKSRKTPFIVALNKVDRLYQWRSNLRKDMEDLISSQQPNSRAEFNTRKQDIIVQLAEKSINASLFFENPDQRSYVSLVPTSAHTGDGMGNLINLIIQLTQSMLSKKVLYIADQLDATVLEVKAIPGLGTTIDVILVNGKLKEGDKIVLAGHDGPIVTQIRALLVPQPLKELRVKSPYEELKIVYGSMGVKIAAHDLEKAVAGLTLYVGRNDAEIERLKTLCWNQFGDAMKAIKCTDKGVYVQASTLGSLEALLEFLKVSKIPYSGIRIGPVVKKDVIKASIMLEHSPDHAVILAFDVKIERDAQELADHLGVKIFSADIIYHLFDRFTEYKENLIKQRKEQNRHLAVFPCKLKVLPNCIFNKRDPIVLGVTVEDGILLPGTPLAVPTKNLDMIGRVMTIEHDHKTLEIAKKGQDVCIKIEHCSSDAPKMYGRHFDQTDFIYSKITRESIDIVKEHFRSDLQPSDWKLMIDLKNLFRII